MKKTHKDIQLIDSITAVPAILDIICRTTGMGFATVARVTPDQWLACAVLDKIDFGLQKGGELKIETTLCNEVMQQHKAIIVDDFRVNDKYRDHHTPKMYGLGSYIAVPITLKDGRFFGTLCAIDPDPAKIDNPETKAMFELYAELIALHIDNLESMEVAKDALVEEREIAELREQFIAILGHDLRNPVGAIRNAGQLMKRGGLNEDAIQRFAGVILNSTYRMTGLIDNLMDFARGRLGSGIELDRSVSSLKEPLEHVIEELQLIWPERKIIADIDLPTAVFADTQRVAQLFSNLLNNALIHGEPDKSVKIKIGSDSNGFCLSVTNHGNNIPEVVRNRIFEPFARAEQQKDKQGLGLGLFISSEIAKAHGGTLEVNCENHEIEFQFCIPTNDKIIEK